MSLAYQRRTTQWLSLLPVPPSLAHMSHWSTLACQGNFVRPNELYVLKPRLGCPAKPGCHLHHAGTANDTWIKFCKLGQTIINQCMQRQVCSVTASPHRWLPGKQLSELQAKSNSLESGTIKYAPAAIAAGEMVVFVDKPAGVANDDPAGHNFLSNYETVSIPISFVLDLSHLMSRNTLQSFHTGCRQMKYQSMTGHLMLALNS